MQAIVTKYLGPTNHRGARVKATCDALTKVYDWDYEIDATPNHELAAIALAAELEWTERNHWTFGVLPKASKYYGVLTGRRKEEKD